MTEFGLNGEINPFNIISFLNIFEGNIKETKNESDQTEVLTFLSMKAAQLLYCQSSCNQFVLAQE